ncbi:hypothetical protein LT493_32395 [Streptomyces tricolor]|nr:hypothetical protein [Streptomyces tricolor]
MTRAKRAACAPPGAAGRRRTRCAVHGRGRRGRGGEPDGARPDGPASAGGVGRRAGRVTAVFHVRWYRRHTHAPAGERYRCPAGRRDTAGRAVRGSPPSARPAACCGGCGRRYGRAGFPGRPVRGARRAAGAGHPEPADAPAGRRHGGRVPAAGAGPGAHGGRDHPGGRAGRGHGHLDRAG